MSGAEFLAWSAAKPALVQGQPPVGLHASSGGEAGRELAETLLSGAGSPPISCADALPLDRLDYSVESLAALDTYLQAVSRSDPPGATLSRAHIAVVMRAGCYLGEVIRRSADPGQFTWLEDEELIRDFPEVFRDEDEYGLSLVESLVLRAEDGFWFPLEKVRNCLREGSVHSTQSFARLALDADHFGVLDRAGSYVVLAPYSDR